MMFLTALFSALRMFFTSKIFYFSFFPEDYQLAGKVVYHSLYDIDINLHIRGASVSRSTVMNMNATSMIPVKRRAE